MTVISLHIYGDGTGRFETFKLDAVQVEREYRAQLLRREIENDNDPDFVAVRYEREDRRGGFRRSPSLCRKLKVFGRFAEILATPRARIERSRWRDMPPITFVAPHALQCVCYRCLKLQQTTYSGDGGPDFAVPTYIATPGGYRTVPHELEGRSAVLIIDGFDYVLAKRIETDASTGNTFSYDAWVQRAKERQDV